MPQIQANQSLYDPLSLECQDDPYPGYRLLLDRWPLYRNEDAHFWAICRFEDVQRALRDWTTYSNAQGVNLENFAEITGPEMLNMDPPRHDILRMAVHQAFTQAAIGRLHDAISAQVDQLLAPLRQAGGGDLAQDFSQRLPVAVICQLLGIPPDDIPTIQRTAATMLHREPGSAEIPSDALQAGSAFRAYFADLCAERTARPRDDVITALVSARPDGQHLSQDEIVGMCVILYSAGNTTTSSLISNGLWILSQHAEHRARLVTAADAIPNAIEELLRFESPVQYTSRVTTRAVEAHGQIIPAGDRVVMITGAANRDGRRWTEPDTFDPFRPLRRNLAFGEGKHFCIGAPLARLEARIAFEAILRYTPKYEVTEPVERLYFSPERGLAHLKVRF